MRQVDYRETAKILPYSTDGDSFRSHIRSALARNLPELAPAFIRHDGNMVLCGSGPSLPSFIEDVKKERESGRPIVAIKGAHDLLVENGLEPDMFVSVETRDRRENLKLKNKNTIYLLASRVSPLVFDHLEDCRRMVFHSWSQDDNIPETFSKFRVGGGTTSGLRAISIGYVLGFRKFTLYGFDSCLASDNKTKRFTGESAPENGIIDRIVNGRIFLCNGALAMQADEVQEYMKVMPDLQLKVKGDGLIAAIWAERKRLGYSGVME